MRNMKDLWKEKFETPLRDREADMNIEKLYTGLEQEVTVEKENKSSQINL